MSQPTAQTDILMDMANKPPAEMAGLSNPILMRLVAKYLVASRFVKKPSEIKCARQLSEFHHILGTSLVDEIGMMLKCGSLSRASFTAIHFGMGSDALWSHIWVIALGQDPSKLHKSNCKLAVRKWCEARIASSLKRHVHKDERHYVRSRISRTGRNAGYLPAIISMMPRSATTPAWVPNRGAAYYIVPKGIVTKVRLLQYQEMLTDKKAKARKLEEVMQSDEEKVLHKTIALRTKCDDRVAKLCMNKNDPKLIALRTKCDDRVAALERKLCKRQEPRKVKRERLSDRKESIQHTISNQKKRIDANRICLEISGTTMKSVRQK